MVFLVWLGFFSVFFDLDSVRFFWFQTYKTETEPVDFLKILIGLINFFLQFNFFNYFSFIFLNLIDYLVFLLTLKSYLSDQPFRISIRFCHGLEYMIAQPNPL